MDNKELKGRMLEMHTMISNIIDLGVVASLTPEVNTKSDEAYIKFLSTTLELYMMGIIARDMIKELDLVYKLIGGTGLDEIFHQAGFTGGVEKEFQNRLKSYIKSIDK